MKGIRMSECQFHVNELERTIVCVIPSRRDGKFTRNMVIDFIEENFMFPEIDFFMAMEPKLKAKLKMPSTFIGKAVCAPGDTWDEETGKLIAFSRAKDKYYKSFFKRANLFVQTIDNKLGDIVNNFNDLGLKLEDNKKILEAKIEHNFKE